MLNFQEKEISDFFSSKAFDEMLLKVANDDVISFKNNNAWLQYHPAKAKIFAEVDNVWSELKQTYNGSFKNLVFGDFPSEDRILQTLKSIRTRLESVSWGIIVGTKE